MAKGGYNRIFTEVENIIQKHYTSLLDKLNVKKLVDYLYEEKMVSGPLMEKIEKADSRREANKVYIDHLRSSAQCPLYKSSLNHSSTPLINSVTKYTGNGELLY